MASRRAGGPDDEEEMQLRAAVQSAQAERQEGADLWDAEGLEAARV